MSAFLEVRFSSDREQALRLAVKSGGAGGAVFQVDLADLSALPGSPFAYWLGPSVRDVFRRTAESPLSTRIGAGTLGDERFLRVGWETPPSSHQAWTPFAKGGEHSRYYLDVHVVLHWGDRGRELKAHVAQRVGSASRKVQSVAYYGRPGLFWSRRSQKGFSVRALPKGCVFADTGPAAFISDDDPTALTTALAVINSAAFRHLLGLFVGFGSYEVGPVGLVPIPETRTMSSDLARLAHCGWSLMRSLDTANEVSHAFVVPAVLQVDG